jgi:SAM-dependent methyltransferase
MQNLTVAEINAAGNLHPFLAKLPSLRYSEYGSTQPEIPSEDLQDLSYEEASFDVVLNSDVLEHVPDVVRALAEIRRVLKPDGLHIFSVPVVWNQPHSRLRAEIRNGQLEHLLPPSHHGDAKAGKNDLLVFHEFGRDFVQLCEHVGYSVELVEDPRNPALVTFVTRRSG